MLLGKRPRPPMRRTTSLTEFSLDVDPTENNSSPQNSDPDANSPPPKQPPPIAREPMAVMTNSGGGARRSQQKQQQKNPNPNHQQYQYHQYQYQHQGPSDGLDTRYLTSMLSPRNTPRRNSGDFVEAEMAHFLRACGLCKRRLGPGRDTYMYRGEVAFCSLECRQQQMNQDERREKCSFTSTKKEAPQSTATSDGETAAAA